MFDRYLLNKKSIRNISIGSSVIGFKFAVRNSNYRGVFVSLHNGYYLVLDGELIPREKQSFQVNGKPPRSFDEICNAGFEHWDFGDEAWVYVDRPGGLSEGRHQLIFKQSVFAAYGYFPGHEEYVDSPPDPGPDTRHFLIMDKTYSPVSYEFFLPADAVVEVSV
ncbi:C-glycoside deglycosidase beta subunit domain-containing protein [Consotaella aegiceratis]|uniref:C-glycoside deglycosidase beta subunit domain-containing protein n=1 Tax=Consotaella aegiceratis TaxID=3097961 RepID=UPI002F40E58C